MTEADLPQKLAEIKKAIQKGQPVDGWNCNPIKDINVYSRGDGRTSFSTDQEHLVVNLVSPTFQVDTVRYSPDGYPEQPKAFNQYTDRSANLIAAQQAIDLFYLQILSQGGE